MPFQKGNPHRFQEGHRTGVTHGLSRDGCGAKRKDYECWLNMIYRCERKSCQGYQYYGARGVTVYGPWREDPTEFVGYVNRIGWAPGLEIHRLNNDLGYVPGNICFLIEDQHRDMHSAM